jgi:hypothetical protein
VNDLDVDPERIRREHLARVRSHHQFLYLVGVIGGMTALMLIVLGIIELVAT